MRNVVIFSFATTLTFIPLSLFGASISGYVSDLTSGEPVAGVQVDAYTVPVENGWILSPALGSTAATDASGAFALEGLAAGSYHLYAKSPGTHMYRERYSGEVLIGADQDAAVNIELERNPFVITALDATRRGAEVTVLNNTDKAEELVFWANVGLGVMECVEPLRRDFPLDVSCRQPFPSEITVTRQPVNAILQPGSNTVQLPFQVPRENFWTLRVDDLPRVSVYGGFSIFQPAMYPAYDYLFIPDLVNF